MSQTTKILSGSFKDEKCIFPLFCKQFYDRQVAAVKIRPGTMIDFLGIFKDYGSSILNRLQLRYEMVTLGIVE